MSEPNASYTGAELEAKLLQLVAIADAAESLVESWGDSPKDIDGDSLEEGQLRKAVGNWAGSDVDAIWPAERARLEIGQKKANEAIARGEKMIRRFG